MYICIHLSLGERENVDNAETIFKKAKLNKACIKFWNDSFGTDVNRGPKGFTVSNFRNALKKEAMFDERISKPYTDDLVMKVLDERYFMEIDEIDFIGLTKGTSSVIDGVERLMKNCIGNTPSFKII
eukprot:Awhi_evm1s14438